jgi:hypothetical protein
MRKVGRFRALVDVLRWRRIPVREAGGRIKFVRAGGGLKIRLWTVILGLLWALMAVGAGLAMRKHGVVAGVATGLLMLVAPYFFATLDRFKDAGRAHVRRGIGLDRCPWCTRLLPPAGEDHRRTCRRCAATWWDVPDLEPGLSPRKHGEHVLAMNIAAALFGLALGWVLVMGSGSGTWKSRLIGDGIVLFIVTGFAAVAGRNGVLWQVAAPAVGVVPMVLGLFWMRGADAWAGVLMFCAGGAGLVLVALASRAGWRRRRRRVQLLAGRVCARCGYDMRALAIGDKCPECGSRYRIR